MDRKGRVFVNLIYECPDYDTIENDGRIVGLDRGIYNIVTTSEGVHYGAKDVRRVKRKYNHVRSVLQEKGTRSARRRLKAISGCEKRFVHDQNIHEHAEAERKEQQDHEEMAVQLVILRS